VSEAKTIITATKSHFQSFVIIAIDQDHRKKNRCLQKTTESYTVVFKLRSRQSASAGSRV